MEVEKLIVESFLVDMLFSGCGNPGYGLPPEGVRTAEMKNVNAFPLELLR